MPEIMDCHAKCLWKEDGICSKSTVEIDADGNCNSLWPVQSPQGQAPLSKGDSEANIEAANKEAKQGNLKPLQTIIINTIVEDAKRGDFELLELIIVEAHLDMLEIVEELKRKHSQGWG